jgi:hypothetical protein
MKSLTRTMTVLVVLSLAMGGLALAQNPAKEKTGTYVISGSVGMGGVTMRGLPGEPVTASDGTYSARVSGDWVGTVTPTKEGYSFTPPAKAYLTPIKDMTNQDYVPAVVTYTISGRVGLAGVLMKGLPGDPISDNEGAYSARVPHGWSGTVTPTKEGYSFMPSHRGYKGVTADLNRTNQDYVPTAADEGMNAKPTDVYGGAYGPARGRVRGSTGYQPAVGPVGSRRVLVVPADQVDPKQLAEMTEDMQVMSYILDERFKETRRIQGVFIDFGDFFGRDNRQTEATYIQGYGVLFAMEVNFSFSPPPKPQAQGTEPPAEPADSTWQRAKQQVFSPRDTRGAEDTGSPKEYNSQMVEELKRDLITTLKHAANIRGLQPDEWVILTVVGGRREFGGSFGSNMPMMGGMSMSTGSAYRGASSGGIGGFGGYVSGGAGGGYGGAMGGTRGGGMGMAGGGMIGGMGGYGVMGSSSSTVLTIRAKKSDVDAFAGGELDLDRFQEKVTILLY